VVFACILFFEAFSVTCRLRAGINAHGILSETPWHFFKFVIFGSLKDTKYVFSFYDWHGSLLPCVSFKGHYDDSRLTIYETIKAKLTSAVSCKSHRFKTANIKILSASYKHGR